MNREGGRREWQSPAIFTASYNIVKLQCFSSFFSSQNQRNVELPVRALIEIQFVSLMKVYQAAPEQVVSLEARRN